LVSPQPPPRIIHRASTRQRRALSIYREKRQIKRSAGVYYYPQAYCGAVRNCCGETSVSKPAALRPSAAPLPTTPAIDCTSAAASPKLSIGGSTPIPPNCEVKERLGAFAGDAIGALCDCSRMSGSRLPHSQRDCGRDEYADRTVPLFRPTEGTRAAVQQQQQSSTRRRRKESAAAGTLETRMVGCVALS
jgi:hypothetical protein